MSPLTGIRAGAAVPLPPAPPDPRAVALPPAPRGPAAVLRVLDEHREICAVSRSTVQAAIEVLAGTRPAQQLCPPA